MTAPSVPQKRVLVEASSARGNVAASSPSSSFLSASKKRKLEPPSSASALPKSSRHAGKSRLPSSQPKSTFETDVLERLSQDISNLKQHNAEKDQVWKRPPVPPSFDPATENLTVMTIEAEEGTLHGDGATVKLFGITDAGNSVLLHVTDFKHYFYVAAPVSFTQGDCAGFQAYLETQLSMHQQAIHSVALCMRENIYGFQGNVQNPYIKITVNHPRSISQVRTLVESGAANWNGMWKLPDGTLMTYDNIAYVLRFMVDCSIYGMSWVELPAGKFQLIRYKQSNCQIEADISYRDLIAHKPVGEWSRIAPLRILSFDIECAGRKGIFPEPNHDPVIQIANVVTKYGEKQPFVRNVFCLDSTSPIVAAQILEFSKEDAMLSAWQQFIQVVDPDVITGYNISNFDFPYLLDRAEHLQVKNFDFWSRTRVRSFAKKDKLSSKQMGNRESKTTKISGRLQLDMLQLVQRDHMLRSYTLNSVCSTFLGEQKEDVHYSIITELFEGTSESRRRLALYCLKDAYLPQRLMDKLSCLENYTEMARVTGVPFNFLLARGQQVKFISQLFRKALEQKLVVPNLEQGQGSSEAYEGATVIEPIRGYYDVPIATLDFASLYPSIMQAHNLCYTSLIKERDIKRWNLQKDEDYIVTPNGDMFVTTKQRKGLLAQILEELLSARKQAKRELAQETDPFKKAVLNGRQLALKISANSVYGLTGATNGKLPCLEIAGSTTSFGRQMIERTKQEVEAKYCMANGYAYDAQVIYGDTDSVMVKFGTKDLEEAMKLGLEASQHVSSKFVRPIKLEFEKVYFPYLLINKKRYAGLYWTKPAKYDKMDTKGIETVRRDNCLLVQTVIDKVLRMILIDRDVPGAQTYVKNMISDLLQNKIDMSKLVITKALSKEDYTAKQAHVELAQRMKKRDAGSAPGLGDRVAYVMIKGATGSKNFERSEDPIYVLEHNVPIDSKYYLDNQLAKPLERIFEPILGESKARSLLNGDHTRAISVTAPSVGGLMRFTKKTQTCMGCKKPLTGKEEEDGAVCADDASRVGELYKKTLDRTSELEVKFGRLWTQCQRCQGSMHCEVICSAKDCPIFYMRMKAKKDLEDANKELRRFDVDQAAVW